MNNNNPFIRKQTNENSLLETIHDLQYTENVYSESDQRSEIVKIVHFDPAETSDGIHEDERHMTLTMSVCWKE